TKRIKKSNKSKGDSSNYLYFIKFLWSALGVGLLLAACVFIYISKFELPDTKELEQPKYEIATRILSDDGRELGKAFTLNRVWLQYEEINPKIIDALVSTEDERFFSHSGIDARGTLRAIVFLGKYGGASTITQQLAKLFFTQRSRSFFPRVWQKLKEWVIAIEFEKQYTKEEILAMYLNKYDYLHGANGIAAAANTYFGKDQANLSVSEAAMLVGLLKNPWIYNPKNHPENAHSRRTVVMKQMVRNGKLKEPMFEELNAEPIDMSSFKRIDNYSGIAPYFRAELVKEVKQILEQEEYSKPDGTKYNLYTDGLVINTTIDYDMQRHAEAAMKKHMQDLQKRFFIRWKGKDPWKYGADKNQLKIRQSNLNRQIRESQRFKRMRLKYLSPVISEIKASIENVRLLDTDIFRLFAEDKKKGTLASLVRKKIIRKDQSKVYKKILESEYWPALKKQWKALQKAKDKAFNAKVKMKVFAYNPAGEKTVEMTPLDSIKYHNMHMQLGSVSVDPVSGYVKTWVGGIGHEYFKYDHINSNRQVGSTFKPFIYATNIIEKGTSPCQKVQDIQYSIGAGDKNFGLIKSWAPTNSDNKFTGEYMTLKDALKKSKNSISVYLMKEIGNTEPFRKFAAELGIDENKIPNYPSICLGTPELSVMEMAGSYTAFANDGIYTKPTFIKTIQDANGRVIYVGKQERKRAINSAYNYVMVDMLKHAASSIQYKYKLRSEVAGKTGTTNDFKDGWFMGMTPDLVVATWVGGDNPWIRFRDSRDGYGGMMARPYFVEFLTRLENDPKVDYDATKRFFVPKNQVVHLDCSSYEDMEEEDLRAAKLEKAKEEEEFDEEFDET
ncbi:MAG: transglycosylase domain-containing protein, partial [Bacteroidota bacterium]